MTKSPAPKGAQAKKTRRTRISQTDVPGCSLDDALRIPKAVVENYAGEPTAPLAVAQALDMQPTSGTFRGLCGAAIAYGLTDGGYNANEIALCDPARSILLPVEEGEDVEARRAAILRPRVFREFLEKYDNARVPREDIAHNVLAGLGVPRDRCDDVLALVLESAESVEYLRTIKGTTYVDLGAAPRGLVDRNDNDEDIAIATKPPSEIEPKVPLARTPKTGTDEVNKRVFVTHGKNMDFVEPIKQLLAFGELDPVVSVERESISQPVPDKVMDDMRACAAAIIHVDAESRMMDDGGNVQVILNSNVLIEIGAAMALYGHRFILLVREDVKLPSNLQGLYEVRYSGDGLDGDATIRLMKAINAIKDEAVPARWLPQSEVHK